MPKEYIEREAAKEAIFEYICGHTMSKFSSRELLDASKKGAEGAMYELENVPAANVMEVDGDINFLKKQKPKAILVGTGDLPIEYVPVVRCKDCKWCIVSAKSPFIKWCNKHATHFRNDDYCSYGERKEV